MIHDPATSNTEYHAPDVNALSKVALSAPGARDRHSWLATRCIRKMAFWNTFDGVNRHSSSGDRAAKVSGGRTSYRRLPVLREEATSTTGINKEAEKFCYCIVLRLATKCQGGKHPCRKHPAVGTSTLRIRRDDLVSVVLSLRAVGLTVVHLDVGLWIEWNMNLAQGRGRGVHVG